MTLEFQFLTWYMHTYVASRQTHICSKWIDTHMWGVDRRPYVGDSQICRYNVITTSYYNNSRPCYEIELMILIKRWENHVNIYATFADVDNIDRSHTCEKVHTMLSWELNHTYHLECCLGETDQEPFHKYGSGQYYQHLQMLHIY
jgi:hypothetical protein